jgi:hypothetical protein
MPSNDDLVDFCDTACQMISAAGFFPMIYASQSWLMGRLRSDKLSKYAKWIAWWYEKAKFDKAIYPMWQKTSKGIVKGIIGNVDMNEAFVDAELLKVGKMFKEMVDTCPPERAELKADYEKNYAIVSQYVPHLIDNMDDILALILDNYEGPLTKKDLMRFFSANYKGKVDMKVVNQAVSEIVK